MPDILKRALSVSLAAVLLTYDALHALFSPIVRPVVAWAASLHVFKRLGAAIAALPPYAVLTLLAVPFAAIEPFKLIGLYWIAQGRVALGIATLATAYLLSFLVCERIFHAGRGKLLTIGWFSRGYIFITSVRDRAAAWVRATAAWRACAALVATARGAIGRAFSA